MYKCNKGNNQKWTLLNGFISNSAYPDKYLVSVNNKLQLLTLNNIINASASIPGDYHYLWDYNNGNITSRKNNKKCLKIDGNLVLADCDIYDNNQIYFTLSKNNL